jgi:hypothetical protein
MTTRLQTPMPRREARRVSKARTERPDVAQFQSWQRWMPSQTAPLVRLVRALAH